MYPSSLIQSLSCLGSKDSTHAHCLNNSHFAGLTSHKVTWPCVLLSFPQKEMKGFSEAGKNFICLSFLPSSLLLSSSPTRDMTPGLSRDSIPFKRNITSKFGTSEWQAPGNFILGLENWPLADGERPGGSRRFCRMKQGARRGRGFLVSPHLHHHIYNLWDCLHFIRRS